MGVKGDNVGDAHGCKLIQSDGAVQGFPLVPPVLAAFIQKGHHYVDPVGGGNTSADDPFQILEMAVRGQVVYVAPGRVSNAVAGDVCQEEKVRAPYGFLDGGFGFTGFRPGARHAQEERIHGVIPAVRIPLAAPSCLAVVTEFQDMAVDFLCQSTAALQGGDFKRGNGHSGIAHVLICHE